MRLDENLCSGEPGVRLLSPTPFRHLEERSRLWCFGSQPLKLRQVKYRLARTILNNFFLFLAFIPKITREQRRKLKAFPDGILALNQRHGRKFHLGQE